MIPKRGKIQDPEADRNTVNYNDWQNYSLIQMPQLMSTVATKLTSRSTRNEISEFMSKRSVLLFITVVPAVLLFAFVNLIPIIWAVVASFYTISPFSTEWTWVGLQNYENVIASARFWDSIWLSVVFAVGSVTFQLITGVGIALLITKKTRAMTWIRSIIFLPYLVPTAIIALIALWMGNTQFGIINQILLEYGLIDEKIPWFASEQFAMAAVILTGSWKFTIFVTIMVVARLQAIPDGLYEAATVLGATPYQKFRDITLPNLKGVIFIVLLLRGIWMFNKFDLIWVLTGGGPFRATTTSAILAFRTVFDSYLMGRAAAISTILFSMLIVGAALYFYFLEPSQEVRTE